MTPKSRNSPRGRAVRRIRTEYDPQGNAFRFTSFSDTAGTGVVNQVQRGYNGLGQLIVEYQAHGAAVNTSTSPKVQYGFSEMASSANHSRLTSMTYPNGRVVNHNYDTGLDSTISRLSSMSDTSGELESYKYMGLGTVVERGNDQTDVYLTYIGGTGDAGDQYEGLDRFGRVVDHKWYNADTSDVLDQYLYTHDRNSNRLSRLNPVASDQYSLDFDEFYTYDDLNQILTFDRDARSQEWDYDGLGNWNSITNDGGSPETRTHNAQNEITGIAGATTPTYDENGNMTGDEADRKFVYDAWNRMVLVTDDQDNPLVQYEYDALTRRIYEYDGTDERHLYYSPAWQVLEERISDTPVTQYVWSPVYIDAMILRDRSVYGELDERLWVAHDANFNVTMLMDVYGDVVERFTYTPFGVATVHDRDFTVKFGGSDFVWLYRHQGGRWSAESGLVDFRYQGDYSNTLGRFLTLGTLSQARQFSTHFRNIYDSHEYSTLADNRFSIIGSYPYDLYNINPRTQSPTFDSWDLLPNDMREFCKNLDNHIKDLTSKINDYNKMYKKLMELRFSVISLDNITSYLVNAIAYSLRMSQIAAVAGDPSLSRKWRRYGTILIGLNDGLIGQLKINRLEYDAFKLIIWNRFADILKLRNQIDECKRCQNPLIPVPEFAEPRHAKLPVFPDFHLPPIGLELPPTANAPKPSEPKKPRDN